MTTEGRQDNRGKAGMTTESRFSLLRPFDKLRAQNASVIPVFSLSVIPVKTGIQDVVGVAHYSILQLAQRKTGN
jgi:hypothetical protein